MQDRMAPSAMARKQPAGEPPHPLPAATIALIRDGDAGVEVLLLHRPDDSTFAPDSWVFPGGRLDADDFDFDHGRLTEGPSAREWAGRLGLQDAREAGAYVVAALREAWEETGILLVRGALEPALAAGARRQLLTGSLTLAQYLERDRQRLDTGNVRYIARWVTPDWLPRRYDTRFFLGRVDRAASCRLEGDELVEFRWMTPSAALERAASGDLKLLPPTARTLRTLEGYRSVRELGGGES